jgi:hypothetical protein
MPMVAWQTELQGISTVFKALIAVSMQLSVSQVSHHVLYLPDIFVRIVWAQLTVGNRALRHHHCFVTNTDIDRQRPVPPHSGRALTVPVVGGVEALADVNWSRNLGGAIEVVSTTSEHKGRCTPG